MLLPHRRAASRTAPPGTGRNGFGGSIAPSPTMRSWPGTGSDGNGGPFAFIGAHYGSRWQVPAAHNNSRGVGYCVMEDVAGEGSVSLQPDPAMWDAGEMARAAALMSSFGGDRVVPYGIDASGEYDLASGEWQHPLLLGGGEYTRRRHVAVNFGVKMFVEDVSPSGAVAGLKLARDTAVVDGSGGEFSALRNGYEMAKRLTDVAEVQHAVGGVRLQMVWATPDGSAPTELGAHQLEVRATDATGKPVGFVPVVALSDVGIDGARTIGATATVERSGDSADETSRWTAAEQLGWPTMEMAATMASDPRFALIENPLGADVTDASGVARFEVTVTSPEWELAFHTQAPTAEVSLYAGTGIQGQITWSGRPQSASVHVAVEPPPPAPAVGAFAVRKVLDDTDVQGARDMSGFEFDVTATDDGRSLSRVTTDADGLTPPIETVAGTYTITEKARPAWAAALGDSGPVTFTLVPSNDNDVVEITYTNTVPAASIGTAVRDASDGDQVIEFGGGDARVIDAVTYADLVPGTEYLAAGELMVIPTGGSMGDSDAGPPIPTGITGSTRFVPDTPDGSRRRRVLRAGRLATPRSPRGGLPAAAGGELGPRRGRAQRPRRRRADDQIRQRSHDDDQSDDDSANCSGHDSRTSVDHDRATGPTVIDGRIPAVNGSDDDRDHDDHDDHDDTDDQHNHGVTGRHRWRSPAEHRERRLPVDRHHRRRARPRRTRPPHDDRPVGHPSDRETRTHPHDPRSSKHPTRVSRNRQASGTADGAPLA